MGVETRLCGQGRCVTTAIPLITREQIMPGRINLGEGKRRRTLTKICGGAKPSELGFARRKYFPVVQFLMLTRMMTTVS